MRPVHRPQREVSHVRGFKPARAVRRKRLFDEILDGRKHCGDGIAILDLGGLVVHVPHQQAVFATDQVGLLDAVPQRLLKKELGERNTGARRLPPPLEALGADAVFDGLVDLLREGPQGMHHRLANRRPHHRVQGVAVGLRIVPECLLQALADGLGQRIDQLRVFLMTLVNGLREDVGDVGRANLAALDPLGDRIQRLLFGAEQEFLKLVEVIHRCCGSVA